MGCWYPDAPTPARLWENVLARRRAFRRLPQQRLPLDSYFDPDARAPDKTYGRKAAVIDGFEFDWIARRIPRRTFEGTDIAHWLALEVALQALEDAGYGRDTLPRERTGVIVGNTLTGEQSRSLSLRVRWPFVERAIRAAANQEGLTATATDVLVGSTQSYFKSVFPPVDEDTLAGSLSNTIAGRICNFLDLQGGGYIVDGACRFKEHPGPRATGVLLAEELFDTSFEDGNVVGNIYFGTYGVWQGRVRDRFFYELSPEDFCGRSDAELICTNFRMTQLREAMPFDRVRVEMRLVALYERAADLSFQYFRVAPDGSETKLAVGEHTAVWATPIASKKAIARDWPSKIIDALVDQTGERRPLAS